MPRAFLFPTTLLLMAGTAWCENPPTAVLRGNGLVPRGDQWELKREALLRRRVTELEQKRKGILAVRRELEQLVKENRLRWSQIGPQVTALQKKLKTLSTDHKDRRGLEVQLQKLRQHAASPKELPNTTLVRHRVKQWMDWELEMTVKLRWAQNEVDQVLLKQQQLLAEPSIRRALNTLESELPSTDRYRVTSALFSSCRETIYRRSVPLYREAQQWRLGVVINQRSPATVSWMPKGEVNLLPASLARSCGARDDGERNPRRLNVGAQRTVMVRPIRLAQLQIGRLVLEDVEAWALPPEAEDLGARLGQYALASCQLTLRPEELRAELPQD